MPPGMENLLGNLLNPDTVAHLAKNGESFPAHLAGVPVHNREVRSHGGGQIRFVDHEQVRLRDAGSAFPRDFVTSGNINYVNRVIGQFPAEMRREVITAGFDEQQLGLKAAVQVFQREEVRRDVLTNRRVRAAACLHGADALGGQGLVADEEFSVFLGEDVIGDGGKIHSVAQPQAKSQQEGGLAAAHGTSHPNSKSALKKVAVHWRGPMVKMAGVVEVLVNMPVRTMSMALEIRVAV